MSHTAAMQPHTHIHSPYWYFPFPPQLHRGHWCHQDKNRALPAAAGSSLKEVQTPTTLIRSGSTSAKINVCLQSRGLCLLVWLPFYWLSYGKFYSWSSKSDKMHRLFFTAAHLPLHNLRQLHLEKPNTLIQGVLLPLAKHHLHYLANITSENRLFQGRRSHNQVSLLNVWDALS